MEIDKKITLLNQITLESLNEPSGMKIIEKFTTGGLKIFGADFGFAFWKKEINEPYQLAYKSPNTPYEPNLPRKKGYNYIVEKTNRPYMGTVKKERISKYDLTPFMKSIIIIPIFYKTSRYGNLVLCFKKKHVFSKEEKSLCIALGNLTAQTITISRLYNNLRNFNRQLEHRVRERTEELRQDKVQDEAILSSIGEGILAVDTEGKIIMANPQAEEILNAKKEDLLNKPVFETIPLLDEHGKAISHENRPVNLTLTRHKRIKATSYQILRNDGKKIPVSLTVTPFFLEGKLIGVIQAFHDIIKEKEIDRAKSELISLASHQLRTPLSAINWYTEALVKNELGKINPKQRKYLQEIGNANQKMIELVYDFLNVSRIELGTFVVQMSDFNPTDIAKGMLKELQPIIRKKRLKILEEYDGNAYVCADKKIIRLILQNLLTNAVKYTPSKGWVKIKIGLSKTKKPKLLIKVSDNGYGIPKEQQNKVFTKLFRGDNIIRLHTEGTGLGLYIVKSFVDLCKGKIRFKSKPGKGTTFHIEMPVQIPRVGNRASLQA